LEEVLELAVISVVCGLALAAAYHLLSVRLTRWAAKRRFMMLPVVAISGFVVRLAVVALILLLVGLFTPLNILAFCLSFVVLFTILNGIWLYSLAVRRPGVPPSAGTTSAN
jgi:hypothetical protein